MPRGKFSGFGTNVTGLRPLQGGQWGMGQGRVTTDEFRGMGYPDNVPGTDSTGGAGHYPGGGRLLTLPRQLNIFFPGDSGSVFNVGNGSYVVQAGTYPFSAIYNASGAYTFIGSATGNFSVLENNQVYQTVPTAGITSAINLPVCSTVVASPLYNALRAGTTMTETVNEIESSSNFSGTITVTRLNSYIAGGQALNGAVITTRTGFFVQDLTVSGGGVQGTNIGLDIAPLQAATTNIGVRIFGTGATYGTSYPNAININSGGATLNFANASYGGIITVGGNMQIQQSASALNMGNFLLINPTVKNVSTVAANMGLGSAIACSPTFEADTQTIGGSTQLIFAAGPTVTTINAGTMTMTALRCFNTSPTVGTGATVQTLVHLNITPAAGAGTVTTQVGIDMGALTGTTPIGIRMAGMTNPLQISQTATGPTVANLTSNTNAVFTVYFGGTNYYFLIAWNDGGTVRYKYLPLTGATATWATGTTLPT